MSHTLCDTRILSRILNRACPRRSPECDNGRLVKPARVALELPFPGRRFFYPVDRDRKVGIRVGSGPTVACDGDLALDLRTLWEAE